jgi:hypothetical protein
MIPSPTHTHTPITHGNVSCIGQLGHRVRLGECETGSPRCFLDINLVGVGLS